MYIFYWNMPNNLRTPITRNDKFYSEEDFEYETDLLIEYIEEDLNQTVVVYEVDRQKTNVSGVYKEAKDGQIRFKPPKEIPCMYDLKDSDTKVYDSKTNTGVYVVNGNLTLYVMPKILEKYKCDIRRGDYIGLQIDTNRMVYFSVVNDGKVNTANIYHVGAYKPAWRTVLCAPVPENEFKGE